MIARRDHQVWERGSTEGSLATDRIEEEAGP
jgi:hypothetical protein